MKRSASRLVVCSVFGVVVDSRVLAFAELCAVASRAQWSAMLTPSESHPLLLVGSGGGFNCIPEPPQPSLP